MQQLLVTNSRALKSMRNQGVPIASAGIVHSSPRRRVVNRPTAFIAPAAAHQLSRDARRRTEPPRRASTAWHAQGIMSSRVCSVCRQMLTSLGCHQRGAARRRLG